MTEQPEPTNVVNDRIALVKRGNDLAKMAEKSQQELTQAQDAFAGLIENYFEENEQDSEAIARAKRTLGERATFDVEIGVHSKKADEAIRQHFVENYAALYDDAVAGAIDDDVTLYRRSGPDAS